MVGGYNRDVSIRKAKRKRRIDRQVHWFCGSWYSNLHQYSKNKIHCSCGMCMSKTRNKNRRVRSNYLPSINYKHSDKKKIDSMNSQIIDFLKNL